MNAPPPRRADTATFAVVEDVAASWEQYARVAAALEESTPPGLILHAAGPTEEGFRIIEIWDSEEACRRFLAEHLAPAAAEAAAVAPVVRELRPAHVVYGTKAEGG